MEGLWERYDVVCAAADGCEPMELMLRGIIYGFLAIGFLVAFFAARTWTDELHRYAGVAISAAVALVVVVLMRNYLAGGGSERTVAIITGVMLVVVRVGRPDVTRGRFRSIRA